MRLVRNITTITALLICSFCSPDLHAQLIWDPDNDLTSNGGDGVWDGSTTNWLSGGSNVAWTNNSDAVFGKKADNSTNVISITSLDIVQVQDITLESPNGTGAVNFLVNDFDGGGPIVTPGGGTWELGGRTLQFVNNDDAFDTALFMTSGDTLTITDSSGGGVFNTGEKPSGADWGVSGATLDVQDGVTLRGQTASVGQFGTVILSDGSSYFHERNQAQTGGYNNNWVLNGEVTFDNRYVRQYAINGVISGSGRMVIEGMQGQFIRLTNSNTFTGGITIDSTDSRSELQLNASSSDASLGAVPGAFDPNYITLRNGGELKMTGITIDSNRGISLDGGGIIVLNNAISEYGGTISGTGGLQIGRDQGSDGNSLRLSSNTHTYTGDTRIYQGKIELGIDDAIPTDHVLTIGGKGTSRLDMQGFDQEIAGLRTLASNTRQLYNNTATESVLTINTPADTSHTYVGNIEYSGGTGGIALVKEGDGVQIFSKSGSYNDALNSITVNGGRLRFLNPLLDNDPNTAPPTALLMPITVNSGGTFVVDAGDPTPGDQIEWDEDEIANLLNNATFNGGSLLGINTGGGDFTYAGNITGNQGLNKIQTNTLTLLGTNTYSGPTIVENGTVMADAPASLPNTGVGVQGTEGPGFIGFNLDNWTQTQVDDLINDSNTTFEANAGVELASSSAETYSNVIPSFVTNFAVSAAGSLSTDALTLTGTNAYTGETIIRSGAVIKGAAGSVPSGTLLTLGEDGNAARFVMNGFDQTLSGLRSDPNTSATVEFAANSVSAGTVTIDVPDGVSRNYYGQMGGVTAIDDSNFSVVKNGEGNQAFNGQNTYTGTTTINAGRLVLKEPLASSALNPGDVTIAAGAEIVLEGGSSGEWSDLQMQTFLADQSFAAGSSFGIRADDDDFTFTGVISGDKNFLRVGNQDDTNVTLTQAQTYTGDTFIRRGRLQLSVANNLPTGTVVTIGNVNAGARVLMNGNDQEIAGLVSGGSGGGQRQWNNGSPTTATLTINVSGGESYEYAHTLGNSSSADDSNFNLTKSGAGTQAIGTANYTGVTSVTAGTLLFNGNGTNATGNVTVSSGATVGGTGTVGGAIAALSGSSIAPGASAGTLTLLSTLDLDSGATLDFELSGTDQTVGGGVNDLIDMTGATGSLILDGDLNLSALVNSTADFNADGSVDDLDLVKWQSDYGAGDGSDANGDGLTNGLDFLIWQQDFGISGSFESALAGDRWTLITYDDANVTVTNNLGLGTVPSLGVGLQFEIDDSITGQIDLLVSSTSLSVVPEPSSLLLLVVGSLAMLNRRRN